MSKILQLDAGFLLINETLELLKKAKSHEDIFDKFIFNVKDLTVSIDQTIFIVSSTFNQLHREDIIEESVLKCFRKTIEIKDRPHLLSRSEKDALQQQYVVLLTERINHVKYIASQIARLENLYKKYLVLAKEKQRYTPVIKRVFYLPTYILDRVEKKKMIACIEDINIAFFSIEEFYQSLLDIVRP